MKSLKYLTIIILLLVAKNLNAQVFIGGNVGFGISNGDEDRTNGTRRTNSYSIDLMPSIGKYLSDNLAIGLAFDCSFAKNKIEYNSITETRTSSFGINPFLRYYVIISNKFSIYGQGNIGIDFSKNKSDFIGITSESSGTQFSLIFYPGLNLDISNHLSLFTSINILSVGYNYSVTKEGTQKEKLSTFDLGAGLNNILSIGSINIGAIYKF